jgi:ketosteroid isomerase-like protein
MSWLNARTLQPKSKLLEACHPMTRILLLVLWLGTTSFAWATGPQSEELSPEATLQAFIRAFDNLDWERFRGFFADDATVFYPRGVASRAHGRAEFEADFQQVFKQIRGSRNQPPYMDLQPHDLHIQRFGDVAIATFHLEDLPGVLNRRTIVLHWVGDCWKIVHIHASEVPVPAK